MNRRSFLLGAAGAAAAASLPGRAAGAIVGPVEGTVGASAGTELTLAKMRAMAALLKAAKPRLIMTRMGAVYPLRMLPLVATVTFRRPPPFNPGESHD